MVFFRGNLDFMSESEPFKFLIPNTILHCGTVSVTNNFRCPFFPKVSGNRRWNSGFQEKVCRSTSGTIQKVFKDCARISKSRHGGGSCSTGKGG